MLHTPTPIAFALLAPLLFLQAQTPQPAPKPKVVLVELFTSEGCSDCPPADKLLATINNKRTAAGQSVIAISEHVTYWNHLGWSDPFSSQAFTDRQNAYGSRFNLDSVYTPQMVVNGTEQFTGSDQAALQRALEKEDSQPSPMALTITSAKPADGKLAITFNATGDVPTHGIELMAVLVDDADTSSVLRGENSGHTLTHVAVARSLTRIATLKAPASQTAQLPLPPKFDATQPHHLILFAQLKDQGRVLAVDTTPL